MELTRENYNETAKELLTFLQNSPSCFHAVKNVVDMLTAAGFTEVKEEESWKLEGWRPLFCDPQSVFCDRYLRYREKILRLSDHSKPQRFPNL